MIFITAIHLVAGTDHSHIERVRWLNCADAKSNIMTVAQAVALLDRGTKLYVATTDTPIEVRKVKAARPYIRTVADNTWRNNLLELPRF